MILRRNNLRSRSLKKSKVIPNKIKSHRKKTSKRSSHLVKLSKSTKAVNLLQNSFKKNVLPKVINHVDILKYRLPNVSLSAGKYGLRNLSCSLEDLLLLTSTPKKTEKIQKSKTSPSKLSSDVKKSSKTLSKKKKADTLIQKGSQVLKRKKDLSISPIPGSQKAPNLRKKGATVSSKNSILQTVPLIQARKSHLPSQKNLTRISSPGKIRTRLYFSSKRSFSEDSLQKTKNSSFSEKCTKKLSEVKERKKKPPTHLKTTRKNKKCPLTENTVPGNRKLASSKRGTKKSFQKNESEKCLYNPSKKIKVPGKGLPTKGSLKRKRFLINALKEKNEGYEDDIFENSKFDRFKESLFRDDDSDTSGISITTPKCGFLVTPRTSEKTPRFRDCYSPMELMKARKAAEEYIHHRNKRKLQRTSVTESSLQDKSMNQQKEKSVVVDPEKKKLDFISLAKSMDKKQDKSEDSDEDVYFSDASS